MTVSKRALRDTMGAGLERWAENKLNWAVSESSGQKGDCSVKEEHARPALGGATYSARAALGGAIY